MKLTDTEYAKLFTQLAVPLAVQDLLDQQAVMDDDTRYALHDLIAGQTPDGALLSITLSALLLESRLRDAGHRCGEVLALSAHMIAEDYAPLYLEHTSKRPHGTLFDRHDLDFLTSIPEDLENLSDLLIVVADVLPVREENFIALARILSQQASANALIAEAIIDGFTGVEARDSEDDHSLTPALAVAIGGTNIVPFRKR